MKKITAHLMAFVALAGCDRNAEIMPQPDMAIAPGYIRLDSGKRIQVVGYEKCPSAGYAVIGHLDPSSMKKNCTVVRKGTTSFEISVGTQVGMVTEKWRVVADERTIRLVRPDGDGATVFRLSK